MSVCLEVGHGAQFISYKSLQAEQVKWLPEQIFWSYAMQMRIGAKWPQPTNESILNGYFGKMVPHDRAETMICHVTM